MKSKFIVEIEFEDRPLSAELIASIKLMTELIAKNYVFPFNGKGIQSVSFGQEQ